MTFSARSEEFRKKLMERGFLPAGKFLMVHRKLTGVEAKKAYDLAWQEFTDTKLHSSKLRTYK